MEKYSKKIVAVLNRKTEISSLMNALAQMSIGLGASIQNKNDLRLINYVDADNNNHPNISELPFIILKAKNSNQIRNLRIKLQEKSVNFIDFPDFIKSIGTFDDPAKSQTIKEENIEYFGLTIFDDWDVVTEMTKKFSLWK